MLVTIERKMVVINALVPYRTTALLTRNVIRLATAMFSHSDGLVATARRFYALDALKRLQIHFERWPEA